MTRGREKNAGQIHGTRPVSDTPRSGHALYLRLWLGAFRFVATRIICDFDPGRRVIAGLLPAAYRAINPCAYQPFGKSKAQKEMIDPTRPMLEPHRSARPALGGEIGPNQQQ
jgi:hypothetical protein